MMLNMSFLPHGIMYLCTLSNETNRKFASFIRALCKSINFNDGFIDTDLIDILSRTRLAMLKEERLNKLIIYLKLIFEI